MLRLALLLIGVTLIVFQHYVGAIGINTQFIIFIIGIFFLGIPHGAADLLVAEKNSMLAEKVFSKRRFFIIYLGRLILFACILVLFPIIGFIIFILFAAYHFGETDLFQFKTNTLVGKFFVLSYGLLILSVILLHHFEEVLPIYNILFSGQELHTVIDWISDNRYYLLFSSGALFFISVFIYFLNNINLDNSDTGIFLLQLAAILIILFNLPLMLGFTFYFVFWHSILSLKNIIKYLKAKNNYSYRTIINQILFYSFLAIIGTVLISFAGIKIINQNTISGYVFLSLAVLTAPHLGIMYDMYVTVRQKHVKVLH